MWRYCAVNEWSLLMLVQWKLIRSAGIYLPFFPTWPMCGFFTTISGYVFLHSLMNPTSCHDFAAAFFCLSHAHWNTITQYIHLLCFWISSHCHSNNDCLLVLLDVAFSIPKFGGPSGCAISVTVTFHDSWPDLEAINANVLVWFSC